MRSRPGGQLQPATDRVIGVVRAAQPLPRIVRRRSRLHGYGVFALEPINKNRRIIDYASELVRNSECGARESRYLEEGCIWVFRVNRTWSRDAAVGGNVARFINHSCRPNYWWEVVNTTIWIRAARLIETGEELTCDTPRSATTRSPAGAGRAAGRACERGQLTRWTGRR